MTKSNEEILQKIDSTLDQLIHNAELSFDGLMENEIEALQETQETLLSNLVTMNNQISPEDRIKIQRKKEHRQALKEKMASFNKLNARKAATTTPTFAIKKRKKIPYCKRFKGISTNMSKLP